MDPERDPSGDYGYDLAHQDGPEDAAVPRETEETPAPEHPRPGPVRPQDTVGDYGYDEAHGF